MKTKRAMPALEVMDGHELFDLMIESNLSFSTKHEIVEWLWANRKLDDAQYRLAMSRIEHLEKKR